MVFPSQVMKTLQKELNAPNVVLTRVNTVGEIKGLQGDTVGAVYMGNAGGKNYLAIGPHHIEGALQPSSIDFFMIDITDVNNIKVMRPSTPGRLNWGWLVCFYYNGAVDHVIGYHQANGLRQRTLFTGYGMPHEQWLPCQAEYYKVKLDFTPRIDVTAEMKVEWQELVQFIKGWIPSDGVTPFRIFILGRSRIGKSSLLNSLVSALEGELVSIEKVVDGANRGTEHYYNQQLQRINKFIQFSTNEGFESNSANFQYIKRVVRIFDGSEVIGSHMSNNGAAGLVPEYARIPMGAIIHVLCESPDQTDYQIASEINKVLKEERGFVPENQSYFAMTKVDTLQVDGASTLSQYIESTVVQSKLTAIKTGMGCQSTNNIFPVVSIGSWMEKTKSPKIDPHSAVLVLRMLKRILVQANYTASTAIAQAAQAAPAQAAPAQAPPAQAAPAQAPPAQAPPAQAVGGLQKFKVKFEAKGEVHSFGVQHACKGTKAGKKELAQRIDEVLKEEFPDVQYTSFRLVIEEGGEKETLTEDTIAAGTVINVVLL